MQTLIYLHGFLSSPQSKKALQMRAWLADSHPHIEFVCPQLSSYPSHARQQLDDLVAGRDPQHMGVVGSSLGGFWASYLVEEGSVNAAVLINPAVSPHTRFRELMGQPLKSYYSDDIYTLGELDMVTLEQCQKAQLSDLSRYWVMLQMGDETLDYRLAQARYQGAKIRLEEGGSHSFEGFEHYLFAILGFLQSA